MANNNNNPNNKTKSQQGNKNKSKSKKNQKNKFTVGKFFKYFFMTILLLCLLVGVIGVGYVFAVIKTAPELDVNAIVNLNQPSITLDDKGELIDNTPTQEERYIISYEEMPQNLINAYIAIEDERFRTHKGIDVRRILGAALQDVKVILGKAEGIHGASTITQQLIKNTLLIEEASNENKEGSGPLASVNRKIKEIALSLQLEKKMSKDEIIRSYLNTIPLGGYVYGVEAASRYYFGKSAKDLTLLECAYIAGITQAPSYYSAYNTEAEGYPETYKDRTKTVLMKMLELGFITQEQYDEAYKLADENKFNFDTTVTDYKVKYEWFVYPALDQVRDDLKEKYKYTDEDVNKLFVNGGLKIYTTLNTDMQDKVQSVLNDRNNLKVDANWDGTYTDEYDADGVPLLQASATIIDYRTGQVKAMVGGRGNQPAHSTNRAYYDLKSIASTTKPITVYGPAIDTKVITAATPIDDTPVSNEILTKYGYNGVIPKNWDGSMDGFITARDAIAYSKNLTSIKTVDKIGLDTAIEYGEKAGIIYSPESHTMSAAATGQFEQPIENRDGANTTIMASAFGAFGNNGERIEPILYTKVEDATGKVILENTANTIKLFSPQTAYIMYDILKGPVALFDGAGAKFSDMPVSGKTGTTDLVDAFWFSGLTPYYSASVWIGYDNPQSMSGYSSSAAKLWGSVMGVVHEGLAVKEIEAPSGIVKATVCKDSGKLATDLCRADERGNRVKTEYFIEGTEPKTVCDVHVKAKVNKNNNKLATDNTPKNLVVDKVFIKKPNAYSGAADYKYVLPTEEDDTKVAEKINLSQIGLSKNMDLFEAINILNKSNIKYTFKGTSVSGTITTGEYILTDFTKEIEKGNTVELTIKKSSILDTPVFDNNEADSGNTNDNNNEDSESGIGNN